GRGPCGYDTPSTGLIDRQDLLTPDVAQPIGDHAQSDVDGAAGCRIRDDLHRPRRIILGLRRGCEAGRKRQQPERDGFEPEPMHFHGVPSERMDGRTALRISPVRACGMRREDTAGSQPSPADRTATSWWHCRTPCLRAYSNDANSPLPGRTYR